MTANNEGFYFIASCGEHLRTTATHVPARVFSGQVEQLRWSMLQQGQISAEQWYSAKAFVRPAAFDKDNQSRIAVTLVVAAHDPIIKSFAIAELQGLRLFAQSRFGDENESAKSEVMSLELEWQGSKDTLGMPVPLLPLRIPMASARCSQSRKAQTSYLSISQRAIAAFDALSAGATKHGAETGGCLVGRIASLKTLEILDVFAAQGNNASAEQFAFKRRFWLDANLRLSATDCSVVGWCHSHLCDAGYPRTLSRQDLEIFHLHFAAPWSIGVLLCASQDKTETKWFSWDNGNVVELSIEPEKIEILKGETTWRHQT